MSILASIQMPKTRYDNGSGMSLDDGRQEMDTDEKIALLKEIARDRWGDEWAIEQKHWADGTTSEHVYHVRGYVDVEGIDGRVQEKEHLWLDDEGQYVVERMQIRRETIVDREIVADPFDLVDESALSWPWAEEQDGRWHRVVDVDGDERTLACGDTLEESEISRLTSHDPSTIDYMTIEICERCGALSDHGS